MTDEGMTQPSATPDGEAAERSTELVVPPRRPVARPARAVRVRRQLAELRQNPAAMVAVSAAATVGSALVGAGLRRTLAAPRSPGGKPASVAIGGLVVHEVHVVHHVVHHVIAPPAD